MVSKKTANRGIKRQPRPLDKGGLEDLALHYAARFATSGAKLEAYLARKIRERGVMEGGEPLDPQGVVARLIELKYVDDEAYARARASGLLRRGYGGRRVDQALQAAGISEDLRAEAAPQELQSRRAALSLARKRGFGPFGLEPLDRAKREKQIAAMIRAGHGFDAARAVIDAQTIEQVEQWLAEAEEAGE